MGNGEYCQADEERDKKIKAFGDKNSDKKRLPMAAFFIYNITKTVI